MILVPVGVSSVVLLIASGGVAVSALGGAWLLFRNGAALWNKLGETTPDPKLEAWNAWAAEQGVSNASISWGRGGGSGGGSSDSSPGESWGFADALSSGSGSSSDSSSASDSSGSSSDSFSGGGGDFGGGGASGDY